jgi:hypothetical protein
VAGRRAAEDVDEECIHPARLQFATAAEGERARGWCQRQLDELEDYTFKVVEVDTSGHITREFRGAGQCTAPGRTSHRDSRSLTVLPADGPTGISAGRDQINFRML